MSESNLRIRNTERADIDLIIELCEAAYPENWPWGPGQLSSHLRIFPEGQFVAVDSLSGRLVGMAAAVIIDKSKYSRTASWGKMTDRGFFNNHEPVTGRTLYGAEVMVHPDFQGQGVGKALYRARENLVRSRNLLNIQAGARIRGYHKFAEQMTARDYVIRVVRGELTDATLSFQLKRGFHVLAVTPNYFYDDESLNYAAVIEWLNPDVATPKDWEERDLDLLP